MRWLQPYVLSHYRWNTCIWRLLIYLCSTAGVRFAFRRKQYNFDLNLLNKDSEVYINFETELFFWKKLWKITWGESFTGVINWYHDRKRARSRFEFQCADFNRMSWAIIGETRAYEDCWFISAPQRVCDLPFGGNSTILTSISWTKTRKFI